MLHSASMSVRKLMIHNDTRDILAQYSILESSKAIYM